MLRISTKLRWAILLLCVSFFWQCCNIINPAEKVPTYIHIDSFQFVRNPVWPLLPASSNITGVKVYYNNNPIGTFDLPATIPVIAQGAGTIEVAPIISVNGLNNLTAVYPFYQLDTMSFNAQPGKTIVFNPVTSYFNDIVPYLISDFSGNPLFALDMGNRPLLTVYPPDPGAYNGGGTGSIKLLAIGDSSVDSTIKQFAIPKGSAYIEFDYLTTIPFAVGLQANIAGIFSTPFYLGGVFPNVDGKWRKFYLSVADFNAQYQGSTYNFYISATLGPNQTSGRMLIDNIYLITLSQ